jgi:hypothetical protein
MASAGNYAKFLTPVFTGPDTSRRSKLTGYCRLGNHGLRHVEAGGDVMWWAT